MRGVSGDNTPKRMKRTLIWMGALLVASGASAQPWNLPGNGGTNPSTNYVGTTDNNALMLRTNATQRLRINANQSYTIGSFAAQVKDGAVGLCPNNSMWSTGPGPFSSLHLAANTSDNMQAYGYRPWMQNGITLTGNADQGYLGQKYTSLDNTDMVIQWSDNPAGSHYGTDRMRFIFTNGFNGSTSGARSMEGLEGMRLFPKNDKEINVGIGDFNAFGGDPTERLHVRDGRVRIQKLPDDPETDQPYKVMVVDASTDPNERGVVKWKNISGFGDCTWKLQANNDVASVYDGSSCPWNYDNFVGVGVQFPKAKLEVEYDGSSPLFSGAVTVSTLLSATVGGWGVAGHARTPLGNQFSSTALYGVGGFGSNAKYTYGVSGLASNGAPGSMAVDIIGVAGVATANANAQRTVGVYGKASGATGGNDWAAWFDGSGFLGASTWSYSDGNLKQDLANLPSSDVVAGLMELHPKSYIFDTLGYPYLHFPSGTQLGLISQEVEPVFPELVQDVIRPAQVDSLGNIIEPELAFKAMNYQGFIPLLIAGFQAQQQEIAALQAQVAQCCASNPGMTAEGNGSLKDNPATGELREQRLLIVPNPVVDLTTLEYYVPVAGKVVLQVASMDGRPLGTLREEMAEPGAYSYQWNTGRLAPGTYLCTYMLDGTVVVQKAVKVAR